MEEAGGEVSHRWVVEDCFEQLYPRLEEGLAAADVTVISGGSSVGTRDLTAQLIEEAGRPGVLVHGVAVRPGKPTIIGLARGKPIFGLPGHPVSALITFDLFVRPCLERLQGRPEKKFYPTVRARLNRNVASAAGREDYVRVILHQEGEEITAEPVLGKSGLISTMARAHGLVRIPPASRGFSGRGRGGSKVVIGGLPMAKERKIYLHNEPPAEARERFFSGGGGSRFRGLGEEIIPVEEAVGRITAAPVFARHSVPHYHSAAMDGYAVAAENTFGASETSPLRLPVPEKAVPVDTGDPLPRALTP